MVGDITTTKTKQSKKFHRVNGFLSPQLELKLVLGFRLRLTKNSGESLDSIDL